MRLVLCSGGFDPIHVGHLDLLQNRATLGVVVVAVNSDDWLMRKKGYVFMPLADRLRIVRALGVVAGAGAVDDKDDTVCEALRSFRPHIFANGGDRTAADPLEHMVCEELGIEELFNVGGGKVRSSSELVRAVR